MMCFLGVVDFLSFTGVCKSWRLLALSFRKRFMASKPPMSMWISTDVNKKERCYLEDFEGRKFKTLIPHSDGRKCIGLTCGYLILYGSQTRDFWLVNPITRHQLHFPCVPFHVGTFPYIADRAILVFSASVSGWLFVVSARFSHQIMFSIAGKGTWNIVSSTSGIIDLHAFNGKIYTLNAGYRRLDVGHLCELRLNPEPKLTLLETKIFPNTDIILLEFVSYGDNLGVIQFISADLNKVHKLDFEKMKWMCPEKTKEEYAFFISHRNHIAAVKRESWWAGIYKNREGRFITEHMCYFPHECLNVNTIDE